MTTTQTPTVADVIVVGAGISGLTAAWHLLNKDPNLQVLVLEAKDRVGGRTEGRQLKSANGTDMWDVGGQWVGSCQPHIMALLEELGIGVTEQYIEGAKFLQTGPTNKVTSYSSTIPTLSIMGLLDIDRVLRLTDQYAAEIDVDEPYDCPKAKLWDSTTLETFVNQHVWTEEAKDVIRTCMRTIFGAELSQLSMLYYLTYVAAADGMKNLTEATENTAQQYKVQGGAFQISQKLYEIVGQSRVVLSAPVSSIVQDKDVVTVTTWSGDIYTCQKLILAIPPMQIGKIRFDPILPSASREIIKRMPPSNYIKFIVTFQETFWRKAGYSGEIVTNGGPGRVPGCDKGPLCVVYDGTSSNGSPALLGFMGGIQAVQWQQQSAEARKSAVLKSLSEFFGEQVNTYLEYTEKRWEEEPFQAGAPVSCVGPGAMKYFAKGLRHPFKNVHFAGTESATVWCGFMNGAVQSGKRAATEVLYDLRPHLVTSQDFLELRSTRKPVRRSTGVRRKIVKLTIGIGVVTIGVYTLRKMYQKYS